MASLWDLALSTICQDITSLEECALLAFHLIWFSALHGDLLLPFLSLTNLAVDFSATMWLLGSTRWLNMRSRKLCAPGPTPDLWSPSTRNPTLTSGFESSTQIGQMRVIDRLIQHNLYLKTNKSFLSTSVTLFFHYSI